MRVASPTLTAGLVLLLPIARPAIAAEYCVTCANPPAMYRCVIAETPDGPGKNPREQLACLSDLSRLGSHETCTASKSAPYPCPGVTQVIAIPAPLAPGQEQTGTVAPATADTETTSEEKPQKPKVPQTVEELAGQTVQTTKEGLKKAGEAVESTATKAGEQISGAGQAVGNAAKKTWDCVLSLFSDC